MKAVLLTTPNSSEDTSLASFVDQVCGTGQIRIEQDFGDGYVRLKSTEALKRQAAQDIRSSEDVVLELLRNARDADAKNIFVALQRDDDMRTIVVIDDGSGIPEKMHRMIFEPRVTSKLDSAHMDKWGIHGRGMALYSISVNTQEAYVQTSAEGLGSSFVVRYPQSMLGEKKDQSTFPHIELIDGTYAMRGPRNILRTVAEFALEQRHDCNVFCGSFTEIAATICASARGLTSPSERAFSSSWDTFPLAWRLACMNNPHSFAQQAANLGLDISERSARRIIDGEIEPQPSLLERLEQEGFPQKALKQSQKKSGGHKGDQRGLKFDQGDLDDFRDTVSKAFDDLAERYYLSAGKPEIRTDSEHVHISIPITRSS